MGKLTVRGIENAKPKDKAYKLIDGDGRRLYLLENVFIEKLRLIRDVIGKDRESTEIAQEVRIASTLKALRTPFVINVEKNEMTLLQASAYIKNS